MKRVARLWLLPATLLAWVSSCSAPKASAPRGTSKPAETDASEPSLAGAGAASPAASSPLPAAENSSRHPNIPASEAATKAAPNQPNPNGPEPPFPCGPFTCQRFPTSEGAFSALIAQEKPRVLGVGEAHARAGTNVPSATRHFTEELLPKIAEHTHSLVVELMAPNAKCEEQVAAVREQQKPVTTEQASTNQNEYVTLGVRARALGVVPYMLRPSCADLDAIRSAGESDVLVMLETIARLTTEQVQRSLASQAKDSPRRMVIAYGGALHNDREPRAGRETWSYGPALAQHLEEHNEGAYVEVDVIVPEFIVDDAVWRAQTWYGHYQREEARGGALLMQLAARRWVLFFPETTIEPAAAPTNDSAKSGAAKSGNVKSGAAEAAGQ